MPTKIIQNFTLKQFHSLPIFFKRIKRNLNQYKENDNKINNQIPAWLYKLTWVNYFLGINTLREKYWQKQWKAFSCTRNSILVWIFKSWVPVCTMMRKMTASIGWMSCRNARCLLEKMLKEEKWWPWPGLIPRFIWFSCCSRWRMSWLMSWLIVWKNKIGNILPVNKWLVLGWGTLSISKKYLTSWKRRLSSLRNILKKKIPFKGSRC